MPKEYGIIVSAEAERNIQEIVNWISVSDPTAAERWYTGLIDALHSLSTFPARCPVSPETELCLVDREIRQLLYGTGFWRYRILFAVEKDAVVVAHIRHGARLYLGQAVLPEDD